MEKPWYWKPLCNAQGLHSTPSVSGRYTWVQSKAPLSFEICMKNSEVLLETTFIQLFWQYKPTLMLRERENKILPSPCWSGTSTHTFADTSEQLWWLLSSLQHVIVDISAPHFIFWLYICASLITLLYPTELGRIRLTNNAVCQHFHKKKNLFFT